MGYYVYNPLDESLQRYAVMPARPVQPTLAPVATPAPAVPEVTPAPQEPQGVTLETWQFYALCGAGGFLLLLVIILIISRSVENARRRRRAAQRRAERERARREQGL